MKHEKTLEPIGTVPNWHTPADARAKLSGIIGGFVEAATSAPETSEKDCAVLALKVTAGLGKTATTLRAIARDGEVLLARGHVLFYVPTLDLAERAHSEFLRLAPDIPSRVIRGREALRPEDRSRQMCENSDLAKKIAGFVPSVTQALCRGADADGNFVQSSCASECPYLAQKDVAGPHVVFLSHAYLTVHPPIDDDYPVVLRVVDEKVWPTLTRISQISVEDFMRAPPARVDEELLNALSRAKGLVVDGLQRDLPLYERVRRDGLTTDSISRLADMERKSRKHLELSPSQDMAAKKFRVTTFDSRAFLASRRRQRIFSLLSEKDIGRCNILRLAETTVDGASRQSIEIFTTEDVPRDAPMLLLDADVDREITERVVPGAELIAIESPPDADIVQIKDLTLSNTWMLDEEKGAGRRAAVLDVLKREVGRAAGAGVLVVATKAVLGALHKDASGITPKDDAGLKQPLVGAVPRWFGPRTQGVNDFEDFATIVVIGRLQPDVSDMEGSARAIFGQDPLPIISHEKGPLPAQNSFHLMNDGSESPTKCHTHPDTRAHSVIAQTRECGTLQAIARLRLVAPKRRKRVVILSNLPLPGFPISRLVAFEQLARGLELEPDPAGYVRMEAALRALGGRSVRGTRLSAGGLAADLPRDFRTDEIAKRFRRGRPTEHLVALCDRVSKRNGWPLTLLALRKQGGGHAIPAVVLSTPKDALNQAHRLWPDMHATCRA
ncbi:hypothetical protein OCH239_13745 [Roseivivax halodurans JCM 10272]|uniref:Helicase/UvrB N-terminal domain-containing protein n=1 Tax=Roseivivax halodurans JCM 10272 TaxID=1449350 RepID=X7EKH4_9RHOB|nr:hypothetical protein [Roseivivax halodurans]ETX15686.1 hypothetical protein OCH239_13745 [Roseivivax halodurans JCM 10272]